MNNAISPIKNQNLAFIASPSAVDVSILLVDKAKIKILSRTPIPPGKIIAKIPNVVASGKEKLISKGMKSKVKLLISK